MWIRWWKECSNDVENEGKDYERRKKFIKFWRLRYRLKNGIELGEKIVIVGKIGVERIELRKLGKEIWFEIKKRKKGGKI